MAERSIWNSDAALEDRLRYYLGPGSENLVKMMMFLPNMVPGGGDAMDIYKSSSALADAVGNLDPKDMLLQGGNLAASIGMVGLPGNKSMIDEGLNTITKKPGEWAPPDLYDSNFMYSPSLLAALNMPQARGPYEQLRAAMIQNGGAKAEELGWTGADQMFAGKEVTREELVEYLQTHQDQIGVYPRGSTGTLGGQDLNNMDWYSLRQEYIDNNLQEGIDWRIDRARDQDYLRDTVAIADLENEDFFSLLEWGNRQGFRMDEEEFLAHVQQPGARWDADNQWFYSSPDDYAERHRHEIEREARKELEETADQMDPEELFAEVHGDQAVTFDPGDTEFSDYMTPGGENYTETFRTYEPTTGMNPDAPIRSDDRANTHFSADTGYELPTLFHTRSAEYPVYGANVMGRTHHVGEIQSDFAQGSRATIDTAKAANLKLDANERRASLNRQYGLGSNYDDYLGADLGSTGTTQHNQRRLPVAGIMTDPYEFQLTVDDDLSPRSPATMATPQQELLGRNATPLTKAAISKAREIGQEYGRRPDELEAYVPFGEDELPLVQQGPVSNMSAAYATDPRRAEYEDLAKQAREANELQRNTLPNAPFMRTTDQWTERALKEELGKAVAGAPGITHFTTGTGKQAREMVGGKETGQTGFYDSIVTKNLDKLLKRYGGKSEPTSIITGMGGTRGRATVPGQALTPEFTSAVRKKGIPKFAFLPLGVMGAGGLYTYGQQDENKGVPYAL